MNMHFDAMALLREMAPLARTLVHEDNDLALAMIADILPDLAVEAYPSGEEVWTWRIPNRWHLREATLRDADSGELLWDGTCHPLATVNYSLPFEGELGPEAVAPHLYSSSLRPEAIPFVYRFYNRDWGLCMPAAHRAAALERRRLGVRIRTEEAPGELKVGVLTLQGDSSSEILIVSDICHPAIANDSLTGAMAAIDLALHLGRRDRLRHTYRFLFLPETIGSIAYLAHHQEVIDAAVAGFFSEMLGNDNSFCLQYSRNGRTYWDKVAYGVLKDSGQPFRTAPFLESAANDEKVLDAPGVDIPTISLTRYPYPEYHTSEDNAGLIRPDLLESAFAVIRSIFDRIEDDYVPVYLARGPVCLSAHNLYPDWYRDRSLKPAWDGFVKVMYALDNRRSCEELAADLDLPVSVVRYWCDAFKAKGFIAPKPRDVAA